MDEFLGAAAVLCLSLIAHLWHKVIEGVEEPGCHWSLAQIEEGIALGRHRSFITAETSR